MTVGLFVESTSAADDASGLPKCITMTSEARAAGAAYDHVVHLKNHCGAPASCTVSTDLEPDPIWAELPNAKDTEVVTLKGSTEYAFQPHAFCVVDDH